MILAATAGSSCLCAAEYAIAPDASSLEVHVPKAGLLSFAGHEHTIVAESFAGAVTYDPARPDAASLRFEVPVESLLVTDEALSEKDRGKVRATMLSETVLNAGAQAAIRFESTSIEVRAGGEWAVDGMLEVAGTSAPVSFLAAVETTPEGTLAASGSVELALAAFGIEPVSALAGTVRTGKSVEVRFQITALPRSER